VNQRSKKILRSVLPGDAYAAVRRQWHKLLSWKNDDIHTAYQRSRLWPRILATPPLYTDPPGQDIDISVHLMCHQPDYVAAIWALKSFYYQAQVTFPLVIHVQGLTTPELRENLRKHFPTARVILQDEADEIVNGFLTSNNLKNLHRLRSHVPMVQKLTDNMIMAGSRRVLNMDSDILFFNEPTELTRDATAVALFQRDFQDSYVITKESAKMDLGIELKPQLCAGLALIAPSLIDWARCESRFAHPAFTRLDGQAEQTLYALEASRSGRVSYLPDSYAISAGGPMDCSLLKARHYAGGSRPLFTREGIPYLIRTGFLEALESGFGARASSVPQGVH